MIELSPGVLAPDFEAIAVGGPYGEGGEVHLSAFRGCTVVLYFYPKDDTPGCTVQACAMRDRWGEFSKTDTHFFGISADGVKSHQRFIDKHHLPFPLISDESHEIASAYGVWVEKSMYGKVFFGIQRSTFVIRPDGRVRSIYRKVKPAEHADILMKDFAHREP